MTEQLQQAMSKAEKIPGVNVELIGSWVWVTGATPKQGEQLKEAGYKFSAAKNSHYFAGSPCKSRKRYTLPAIRELHGSQLIKGKEITPEPRKRTPGKKRKTSDRKRSKAARTATKAARPAKVRSGSTHPNAYTNTDEDLIFSM